MSTDVKNPFQQPNKRPITNDPFAFDVVTTQPVPKAKEGEESGTEVGGWLNGNMS